MIQPATIQKISEPTQNSRINVSVILPLFDDRGQVCRCVKSWAQKQTYNRDQYEVLVISDGTQPDFEKLVKPLLQPQDSILYCKPKYLHDFYHFGAQHAQAELLLFTELHVIASRKCLAEVVRFFETQDYNAACCRPVPLAINVVSRVGGELFCKTIHPEQEGNNSDRVLMRGFAIRRNIYFALGGLDTHFKTFVERAFCFKLVSQHHNIGYMEKAVIAHGEEPNLWPLVELTFNYAYQEFAYREKYPIQSSIELGDLPLWSNRLILNQTVAKTLRWIVLRNLRHFKQMPKAMRETQMQVLQCSILTVILGARWRSLGAKIRLYHSYLWAWFWRSNYQCLSKAYSQYTDSILNYGYHKYLADHSTYLRPIESNRHCYDLTQIDTSQCFGFHGLEMWQNQGFRWSEPIAMILISLTPDTYHVMIKTLPVRPTPPSLNLQIFFDTHPIHPIHQNADGTLFSFTIQPKMFNGDRQHILSLLMNPLRLWELGG